MALANNRWNLGFRASLMAPVLVVGIMAAAPASAAGLGGVSTLADIQSDATSNIIQVAGRHGRHKRRNWRRHGGYNNHAYQRRKNRRRKRRNAAIGIGLGILGAAVLANRHYDRRRTYSAPAYAHSGNGYRAAKRKCARVYGDDYVWRTDLVYDAYGDARVCKFVKRLDY